MIGGAVAALLLGAPTGPVILACAIAGAAARIVARPLGLLAQRTLTVSTEFSTAAVGDVDIGISADGRRASFVVPVRVTV